VNTAPSSKTDPGTSFPILKIRDLSFTYDKEKVLEGISLDINEGDFITIIGPNGSGKSTLLKLMGAILPSRTDTIQFENKDINQHKRKTLATAITWVPQEHPMAFSFKVIDVVMMGRHPYLSPLTFESDRDYQIAYQAMEWTETRQFAERQFNEISGGEKQRVLLASALAQEPDLMLLDEPTSALDLKYQLEILNILKRLNSSRKTTIVLAMHDLHLASKFCDRLLLLNDGKLVRDGSPAEVLQKEILEEVYGVHIRLFHDESDGSILISPELP
jgi:iron complex transport system ATP-binding protein